MDFRDTPAEAEFRAEIRAWLDEHLVGKFAALGGRGGPADETGWETRVEWERILGKDRWIGLGWPEEYGGRAADLSQQVIFDEEYAKAGAPARISFFGEGLFAPTLIAFGTPEQKQRFLPKIQSVDELWCQGYSEPNAGSDLANVQTRAVLDGDEWVVNGQKVWTTLAHRAQWCFLIARTDPESKGSKGLSYLLVPMDQPGVEVRPLRQMTGSAEFNEVFFDDARTAKSLVVGEVNDGWKVAMATLGFERGTAFLSQQLGFQRELADLIEVARANGSIDEPRIRQELADSYVGVMIMKYNGMRMLTNLVKRGVIGPESSIGKLYWSNWHRTLGERAMHVLGPEGQIIDAGFDGDYELNEIQRSFMFSRSETIYAGASEIQRNIIGERVLGLPREPR
ncbi:MAG: acyl-CoA dehydrogenase [Actinomycetia bacterium]|nr:acyl-CoA dehydrogenase [Actinomycetes bacterium]